MNKLTTRQFLNLQSINSFAVVSLKREVTRSIETEIEYLQKKIMVEENRSRRIKKILRRRRRSIALMKGLDFISEKISKLFFPNRLRRVRYCEKIIDSIDNNIILDYDARIEEYREATSQMQIENVRSYNFVTMNDINSIPERLNDSIL